MVFYMDLYRKCNFLCGGCVEFYHDRRRQEMLGIEEIVSIEEYNATHKSFCDKCELYEWNHTISFKNGDNYYLARRSLCEIINSTLGMLIHRWIGGTLFRTCITLKSKQRESGASESPCFSQMRSEMRLSMFLQKEMT